MKNTNEQQIMEANFFYDELHALVKRARAAYPSLSIYTIVGALEAVKMDAVATLKEPEDES